MNQPLGEKGKRGEKGPARKLKLEKHEKGKHLQIGRHELDIPQELLKELEIDLVHPSFQLTAQNNCEAHQEKLEVNAKLS